jgi:hypothetical protein
VPRVPHSAVFTVANRPESKAPSTPWDMTGLDCEKEHILIYATMWMNLENSAECKRPVTKGHRAWIPLLRLVQNR